MRTPSSTRQWPGWLGCVFHPVRSLPLNSGTQSRGSEGSPFAWAATEPVG